MVFVDCFSKYTILVPSKDHAAVTVCNALLDQVIPYFGVPRQLLPDRERELTSLICVELLKTLRVQRLLTFPYHPKGNAINEHNHRTINNIPHALLQDVISTPYWADKIPTIMLTLNSVPHQPHGHSASFMLLPNMKTCFP